AIMDRFGRFLPVGFYYRTFMGPGRDSWLKFWEPMIRRKAGLGVVDTKAPHRHFDKTHLHCDVLVVGAGPTGLSAAIAAADAGADVVLCEENPEIGGALSYGRYDPAVLSGLSSRLAALPNLKLLTGTVCNGWYEDNWLPLIHGDRLHRTRAREVILATGAIEQPAVFRNNDLPGVMLGGAAQRLIRHYGVRPGDSAVVLAAHDDGYRTALDLLDASVSVVELVDPRSAGATSPLEADLRGKGVAIRKGATIEAAEGTAGNRHLARVRVGGSWIACD
ncbi:FAD-dependent oxidoreductase, partial [Mesorhizobium sp.]